MGWSEAEAVYSLQSIRKMQIIRLVEESPVSIKQPLLELNINRSTFYKWGGIRKAVLMLWPIDAAYRKPKYLIVNYIS